jgi:hypothetical protein
MSFIIRALIRMGLFIASVAAVIVCVLTPLITILSHNIWFNATILGVATFGIVYCFYLILGLMQEQKWLNRFDLGRERFPGSPRVRILAPIVILLNEDHPLTSLSPIAAKSILSSIEGRLDESRDICRYIANLLVILGLLGTLWGLSQTIGGVKGLIGNIGSSKDFQPMQTGITAALGGMGTAFSCSMFGLAGSLIVGFLDLQVGRAFTTFYNRIEERLACSTRYSSGISDTGVSGTAFSQGLLEQTIEGLSALQQQMKKGEDTRLSMVKSLQLFSEKLSEMSEHMIAHQGFSQRLAQNQVEIQEMLVMQSKEGTQGRNDEIIKTHVRSLDATLTKMLEELVDGRARSTQDIRNEIRVVSRTLAALANNGQEAA